MATQAYLDLAQSLYIAYYGRAADSDGLNFWADKIEQNGVQSVLDDFGNSAEFQARFGNLSNSELVDNLYQQMFDRPADLEGLNFYVGVLESGDKSLAEIAYEILQGAQSIDQATLDAKLDAANAYTDDFGAASDYVLADGIAAVEGATDEPPVEPDLTLTVGQDALEGTEGDDVFAAPIVQNQNGAVTNTLESGDEIDGGGGTDTLNADLTLTTSGSIPVGPATAPITTGVEIVNLRAQSINLDSGGNYISNVDAENMTGVEQWWSDNSRSDVVVEDIRTTPMDTDFGMRDTDPGTSFRSYINANHLDAGTQVGQSAFNFTIRDPNALGDELQQINVIGVRFELDGQSFDLGGADVEAADTWVELQAALQVQVDNTPGLEGLAVTHGGNGQFVVIDPEGGNFVIDPAGTVISSSTTTEEKAAAPGVPVIQDLQTETDILLDGAGNGSQGGAMDVGVMSGDRGVEVFHVDVQSDSHLATQGTGGAPASLLSSNLRTGEMYLEEVYVEGEGSLKLGSSTVGLGSAPAGVSTTTDDRLQNDGLVDVRVFDASGFQQELKVGAALTGNVFNRYLDDATDTVEFDYLLGDGGSNLNLAVNNNVAADPDFALNIAGGASDDRINLTGLQFKSSTTIDGKGGENTVEVNTTTGAAAGGNTAAENSWSAFDNIQTLVVAGTNNTTQDVMNGNMLGLESLIIATGNVDTTVVNLEADTSLTISGKNQTLGNNSNADQDIGTVTLTDAQATTQRVDLDNTARNSGVLTVGDIVVGGSNSNVDELELWSNGERNTVNVVQDIQAADASTVTLAGTQDLSAHVSSLAINPGQALTIDGAALEGDLTLGVNGALLVEGVNDAITGTAGDNDALALYGAMNTDASVSGFETLQLGWLNGSNNFSTLATSAAASGVFDAANTSDVDTYVVGNLQGGNDLTIDNLSNGDTVIFGDADSTNLNQILGTGGNDITLSGSGSGTLNIATVDALNGVNLNFFGDLNIDGFNTINADVARPDSGPTALTPSLVLDNAAGIDLDAVTITGGDSANNFFTDSGAGLDALEVDNIVKNLVITGGDEQQATDSLTLTSDLPASMSVIDVSGYHGDFTATLGNAVIEDPNNAGQYISANTDTSFVLDGDDAAITLTDLQGSGSNDGDGVDFNTIFEFTEAPAAQVGGSPAVTWTINNFVANGDGSTTFMGAGNANYSILDVSELGGDPNVEDDGISSFAQLTFTDVGSDVEITESGGNSTWKIVLTGVQEADLAPSENFDFA